MVVPTIGGTRESSADISYAVKRVAANMAIYLLVLIEHIPAQLLTPEAYAKQVPTGLPERCHRECA